MNKTLITRDTINLYPEKIKLSDSDNKLELFCYTSCNREEEEVIKKIHGVVFNGDNIVLSGFPYTTEFVETEIENIKNVLDKDFNECRFFKSYEGCLIRVFNFDDKWYVSTTRKLNAFKSKWSSKTSFGDLFKEALVKEQKRQNLSDLDPLNWLYLQLDTKYQYMFLLLNNNENRIVCRYEDDKPYLYHVGTFDLDKKIEHKIDIPLADELKFNSLEELLEEVKYTNHIKEQGIIVFTPDNKQYKILNKTYDYLYKLRNNEPSLKFRYLQIRMDKELNKQFRELYIENENEFNEYENILFDASQYILNAYISRYIRKEYVVVPTEEFQIMKQAYEWYFTNPKFNKINYSVILDILNKQQPTLLNHIIKHVKFGYENIKIKQPKENPRLI